MTTPIITLLTDFGNQDHFVATMKGVMLSINPDINIVDISHDVKSYDLMSAGFILDQCYKYYPLRTINVVIVDPGVGTERRPILACGDNHYFIAPDNGVLSYVIKSSPVSRVLEINASHYFRDQISKTFHGRDIFAPVAAWFSKTHDPDNFGEEVKDFVTLNIPKPRFVENRFLEATILHVDHFGNLITNITSGMVAQVEQKTNKKLQGATIGEQSVQGVSDSYESAMKQDYGIVHGSTGYVEIFSFMGNAAQKLRKKRGDTLQLLFG